MICSIIGARPQFVKAAVLSNALRREGIEEKIIHTGQHYDAKMSEIFFSELNIPKVSKNLGVGSGNHGEQTASIIHGIEQFIMLNLANIKGVILYGDTNSTLAGAIVASKLHIPIIHVESGLRSYNMTMPEEVNRIVTDRLSSILFCPSDNSVDNLKKEGITKHVYNVGDIMQEAMSLYLPIAERKVNLKDIVGNDRIPKFNILTIHRPSNTDNIETLRGIVNAIGLLKDIVVWPLHPRLKTKIKDIKLPTNIILREPLSYFEMLIALKNCHKVITDSGGLQKEAYWSKKPCITLRTETEWVETLHNRWNILAASSVESISNAYHTVIDPSSWYSLYGNSNTSELILDKLSKTI
ncbi:MAG: UDP-GlcNAc3NAcA epimerase [Bacteroidia bacterium]|jgi:UDP-GlcNAc3NAcA epimerase